MEHPRSTLCVGYEHVTYELSALVSFYPPPFIYINDPTSPRVTSSVVDYTLGCLMDADPGPSANIRHAQVNAVSCFSPRLLYDSVLNALSRWNASWAEGCANWNMGHVERYNENFDGFVHGLCALHAQLSSEEGSRGKGKGRELSEGDAAVRMVIVIERAERLKESLPDLIVPLTRLAELTQLDLSVIFISEVRWEDIRPSLGASPDPYFIDVPPLPKETIAQRIISNYPATTVDSNPGPYHPSLKTLYSHFISTLCDVCFTFTHDSQELEYIAAARWPGFVQPVLDDHLRQTQLRRETDDLFDEIDEDAAEGHFDPPLGPPLEDVRMRLTRLFTPSLNNALDSLYPRLTNATDWAVEHAPEYDILAKNSAHLSKEPNQKSKKDEEGGIRSLPRLSKFILVAAFLASTNPPKSDLRMFGRGLDEKKRKRRAKATGRTKSGPAKIPQRLVGPVPFPLDRLIAILGALLEENDGDVRLLAPPEYTVPGEYTDMETSRIGITAAIMELTSMRLLHRTSPQDRIDGPPMFKTGISYDVALALARQLDVPLNDLLWDPV